MNSVRDITLNYFKLTFSRRLAIAEKFNLLREEDIDQPDHDDKENKSGKRFFRRCRSSLSS
ncbi:hypothetical protein [Leptospira santarosai]|uniref:hypothetical protein n=1 Tax=Leptospira santarosai TaxID=28183 RepID=UPI0009B7E599|nr:hypothetical protein [Leptospira santarosai]